MSAAPTSASRQAHPAGTPSGLAAPAAPGTVVVVGCGNLGSAILEAVARNLVGTAVYGIDADAAASARVHESLRIGFLSPSSVPADLRPDVVVVAVKPQHVLPALAANPALFENALTISVAAGVRFDELATALRGGPLVRAMPNLAARVGASMTVAYAPPGSLPPTAAAHARAVLGAFGDLAWLEDEGLLDAATAVAGSGPGYAFAFAEQLAAAGVAHGLPGDLAERMAAQVLVGAGRMLDVPGATATALRHAVTSPGGTTRAGLDVLLAHDGLPSVLHAAVAAATLRSQTLQPPASHGRGAAPDTIPTIEAAHGETP